MGSAYESACKVSDFQMDLRVGFFSDFSTFWESSKLSNLNIDLIRYLEVEIAFDFWKVSNDQLMINGLILDCLGEFNYYKVLYLSLTEEL